MRYTSPILISLISLMAYANTPDTKTAQPSSSSAKPSAGEQIKWQVISSGGSRSTSTGYVLSGTVGQTATGQGTSANYKLNHGFWQIFGSQSCCTAATTGDVDASGGVDISDLSAMVDYLFNSLPFPGTCFQEQDVDKSGSVDISDLQAIIDFLFNSVALPSCP